MSRMQKDLANSAHAGSANEQDSDGDMLRRSLPPGRRLRVCVVGAGVAGLRAADTLARHGAEVTILEARNRIGGRVGQADLCGNKVDLGANFIHGSSSDNPIMDLAHQTNTVLHAWPEENAIFSPKGKPLPKSLIESVGAAFWGMVADAFQLSNEKSDVIPKEKSLMDFISEEAEKKFPPLPQGLVEDDRIDKCTSSTRAVEHSGKDGTDGETEHSLLLHEAESWGAFVGSPTSRQSLRFFWMEECIEGENPFVAETYSKILGRIAAPTLRTARVLKEHQVSRIHTGRSVSDPADPQIAAVVEVEAANRNFKESFDEVIVTVPLGYLQRYKQDLFKPRLPARFEQAVDAIGYGCLDKVYIAFPRAFWDEKGPSAPPENSSSSMHFASMMNWASPEYAGETNPHRWVQQALNLAALPESCKQPTLLFYIFGDCSKHISHLIASCENQAAVSDALTKFFHPYFSRLPNYAPEDPVCQPKAVIATGWAADEYAGYGSYSNFQVGLERGDEDVEVMRRGLPDQGLWLAGEHTAPFVALGTVTGAWWAGDGVARRIASTYGLQE